ncbi:MAG: tetratricopeptide repeat protein [Saprospiraceae bacterium]|nr:tetratricopeptide repeat protein [Saprospiraceae bacterium]MBP7643113.1 tetratricopeptide repeat protein [Saprospiraceae bacterium]
MEQRIKRDVNLINLVSDFETRIEQGTLEYLDEKSINQLIDFYEREMQYDKAMEVVDLAIDQFQYRAEYLIAKAKLLFIESHLNESLEYIEKAELMAPGEREIICLKIKIYSHKKEFNKAKNLLEELRNSSYGEDMIDLYVAEATIYESEKNFDMMYIALKKALKINPSSREALEKFWRAVEASKNYADSIAFHKSLIDENPYNHIAWFNLGMSYNYDWKYEKAIDALEFAFIIQPNFEAAYTECGELCLQIGDVEKALDIFTEANQKFGPDSELMVTCASCHLKLGQVEKAKNILQKAMKIDPYNEEIYFYLGQCFEAKQNWYSAINAYFKAIELDSNRDEYYMALAKAYVAVEDYSKATINFNKATQLGSDNPTYWSDYVCFIIRLGLYEEANQILDEAEEFTFGAELLYCRAITYFFLKMKKDGLDILAEALEEDFEKHSIIYSLAPELEIDKDINAMIKYYEREFKEFA